MLQQIQQKLITCRRILRETGLQGIGTATAEKVAMWYRRTGNTVRLDGCAFELSDLSEDIISLLLRGKYELPERLSVRMFLDPGLAVLELGSCIGVLSCITNRMLKHPDRHVVVEANPNLIGTIQRNASRNRCRLSVVHAALSYDVSPFFVSHNMIASGVYAVGTSTHVPRKTLRQLVDEFALDKFTLICDIEGSEVDLVDREGELIAERCPSIIMETHEKLLGALPVNRMLDRLTRLGFVRTYRNWDTSVFYQSFQNTARSGQVASGLRDVRGSGHI